MLIEPHPERDNVMTDERRAEYLTNFIVSGNYFDVPKLVLDIGCGKGHFSNACRKHKLNVVSLDLRVMLDNVVRADAEHMPFKDTVFDLVYAGWFFQDISDFQTENIHQSMCNSLLEVYRVLRPGGILVIYPTIYEFSTVFDTHFKQYDIYHHAVNMTSVYVKK